MKKNYVDYMNWTLLEQFVSSDPKISKTEKEDLLVEAMSLYYGKFQSIWMRIIEPGTEKFDKMRQTFSNFQLAIDLGIKGSIEYAFGEFMRNFDGQDNDKLFFNSKRHFYELVGILSEDKNENWGWRWIAGQNDTNLIFSYFNYQMHSPNHTSFLGNNQSNPPSSRTAAFDKVVNLIKRKMNFRFWVLDGEAIFISDFKSPFPLHIMEERELKQIISTIISKLYVASQNKKND
jgi:hypothetical protein